MSISEITGMEGEVVQMQEIFRYHRVATAEDGDIIGHYQATGVRPKFLGELTARGLTIPTSHFDPTRQM
jgi:pilus assembly protein CpaF